MSERQKVHLSQIDPLRGLAILAVILFHSLGAAYGRDALPWAGDWRSTAEVSKEFVLLYPVTFGNSGVSLFFVISGFLIHYSTVSRGPLDLVDFARKRFWRIYPPYLAALLVFAGLQYAAVLGGRPGPGSFVSHLLLVHNLRDQWVFGINPSFWSLATEWQLYVLYPLLWVIRNRFGSRAMLAFAVVVTASIRLAAEWRYPGDPPMWIALGALTLWFDWALGAYLCDAYLDGRCIFSRPRAFVVLMVGLIFAASLYRPTSRYVFHMTSLLFTALLEMAIWSPAKTSRLGALLSSLGVCSYSVYLFHQPFMWPIANWLDARLHLSPFSRFAALSIFFLGAAWTVGPALYRWIEAPSSRIGRKPTPKPADVSSPLTVAVPVLAGAQEERPASPQ